MRPADGRAPLRILAVSALWQGADDYAYVRAFRRLGHSVRVVPVDGFLTNGWRSTPLRVLQRLLEPALVREYNGALQREAESFRPDLFFVFKGRYVTPDTIHAVQRLGGVAVNVYPDVSFRAHGRYIPSALPTYDWIFQTKTFGIRDLERELGVRRVSFLPPSYDPEVHTPMPLGPHDWGTYACDLSFIGTWSPKKAAIIQSVREGLPDLSIRVWGDQWGNAGHLGAIVQGRGVFGLEYAKAVVASRINLAILSERREAASDGDRITARTFQIPACGAFMLHERTRELLDYFAEDRECACFGDDGELVEKIRYYLAHDDERVRVAGAGRARAMSAGYSVDVRAAAILDRLPALVAARA